MKEKRKHERLDYFDKIKIATCEGGYNLNELEKICLMLKIDSHIEFLLDRTNEWQ